MTDQWLSDLREVVSTTPLVIWGFTSSEWRQLRESRKGLSEFTIARSHATYEDVRPPCLCILHSDETEDEHLYLGIIKSRAAVTTLESRVKITRAVELVPPSFSALVAMLPLGDAESIRRLSSRGLGLLILEPGAGAPLAEALASIAENRGPMRAVIAALSAPKRFSNNDALQEDGIRTAMKAFGLGADDRAVSLELVRNQDTGLARIDVLEDAVIEHEARSVPGFRLLKSDVTGRAVFVKGDERLEVFTANKRPLEKVFGVDLIYLNSSRGNIVMVQYKVLKYVKSRGYGDWIYRPDKQLDLELSRMRRFTRMHDAGSHEYRLNPAVFYMKFVKQHGELGKGGIITPLDHFEIVRNDPTISRGSGDGIRISYNSLNGRYLRETPFLDLVRAGYIGGRAQTTRHLELLVRAVVRNNRAVIGAIQERAK